MDSNDTVASLRSRVDQQSTLIAMLKQRSDTTLAELTESTTNCDLLTAQVDSLQQRLTHEEAKYNQLETKFSILANNHEEMIRIKDEYKLANQHLQAKNKAHQECISCTQLQCELTKSKMDTSKLEQRFDTLEKECSQLQTTVTSLQEKLDADSRVSKQQEEYMNQRITSWEEQVSTLESQCTKEEDLNKRLKVNIEQLQTDKERLTKELLSLKSLLSSCEQSLKESQDREYQLKESFRLCSEEVSKDSCVLKLRKDWLEAVDKLSAVEKDYLAYKKHSSQLLAHERELNNKLRHILD